MSESLEFVLNYPGMRLDLALTKAHPALSRVQWQKLIREKLVTLAGKPVKASLRLSGDEIVVAEIPPVVESDIVAEDLPLDIRYHDDDLIVVNKASGIVVHPSVGNERGTLVNALLHHFPDIEGVGGEKRPGIVHRIDKNTSGLLVVAKNDHTLRHLQAQFKERTVHKVYLALVEGNVKVGKAKIDAPIGRNPKTRREMMVIPPHHSAHSRPAQTTYEVMERYKAYSLVRCILHTGRTHQIRVHLAYIGHPLVGDYVYGRRKQHLLRGRTFLHSAELGFTHPTTGEPCLIKSDLPLDLQNILAKLTL